jgi:predicted dehydrogenase
MDHTTTRMAIAGTGAMAAYHTERFRRIEGTQVVACYDRHGDRAADFASRHGIPASYSSMASLLAETAPDAVAVAVADAQHYAVARAVLEANGPALFIEKPLTATVEEAEDLLRIRGGNAAPGADTTSQPPGLPPVVCNFSKLNYPAVFGAVHLLRYGTLGPIRRLRLSYLQSWIVSTVWGEWWENPRWLWRISSSHGGGGALRDLGSHLFYLLLVLLGAGEVRRAEAWSGADRSKAAGGGFSCDLNDSFRCEVGYADGAVAELEASFARPGHINNVILSAECERGTVDVELQWSKELVRVRRRETAGAAVAVAPGADRAGAAGGDTRSGPAAGTASTSGRASDHMFTKVYSTYEEFMRLLSGDRSLPHWIAPASLSEGVEVQRMIGAAEELARRRQSSAK